MDRGKKNGLLKKKSTYRVLGSLKKEKRKKNSEAPE